MSKLQNEVIRGISGVISDVATNLIVQAGENWRFYFDEQQKGAMKEKLSRIAFEIISNARRG